MQNKTIDKRKTVEIELDFPVQLADRLLERVTMRRPTMKDMLKHQRGMEMDLNEAIHMIADLCGLVPDEIEMLDTCDFERLQDQLLSFRGNA